MHDAAASHFKMGSAAGFKFAIPRELEASNYRITYSYPLFVSLFILFNFNCNLQYLAPTKRSIVSSDVTDEH